MSYWSSLSFVRQGPPPAATTGQIAQFIEILLNKGILKSISEYGTDIFAHWNWGSAAAEWSRYNGQFLYEWQINESEEGFAAKDADLPLISQEPEYEEGGNYESMADLIAHLRSRDEPISRGRFHLSTNPDDLDPVLARVPCDENQYPVSLCEFSFELGPNLVSGINEEWLVLAGWMGFRMSGQGYFYPVPYEQAKKTVESHPKIQELMEICKKLWPASSGTPSAKQVTAWKEMESFWLYDQLNLPLEWRWFVSES